MSLSAEALVTVNQVKNYMRVAPAADQRVPAEYVGIGDGNDKTFSLDNTPVSGSLQLYVASVLQVETTNYAISGADITFVVAPPLNDGITASYDAAAADDTFEAFDDDLIERLIAGATKKAEDFCGRAFINQTLTEKHYLENLGVIRLRQTPVVSLTSVAYSRIVGATGDGTTVAFALGYTPKTDSLTVYVASVLQTVTTDYTLSGATVTFEAGSTPADDAVITFYFQVSLTTVTNYTEKLSIGRIEGSFLEGYEYVVVFVAGYGATRALAQAAVPDAVTAVLETVANWYDNRLGLSTERVDGVGAVAYTTGDLPGQAMAKLSLLRRDLI
jgi:hypothetical protein